MQILPLFVQLTATIRGKISSTQHLRFYLPAVEKKQGGRPISPAMTQLCAHAQYLYAHKKVTAQKLILDVKWHNRGFFKQQNQCSNLSSGTLERSFLLQIVLLYSEFESLPQHKTKNVLVNSQLYRHWNKRNQCMGIQKYRAWAYQSTLRILCHGT